VADTSVIGAALSKAQARAWRSQCTETAGLNPGALGSGLDTVARAASPLFRPPPPKGRRFVAAVGGDESEEFLRQSREIAKNWSRVGIDARCEVVTGTDHFTIVEQLITPGSGTLTQIVALAREADAA
jgi:arylformamidase